MHTVFPSEVSSSYAFPLPAIANDQFLFKNIKSIGEGADIDGIVVGLPTSATETDNPFLKNVESFGRGLKEQVPWPVFFEKENFSSRHAALTAHQKEALDSASAVIILERFLARKEVGEN
jgi:RNase H-fold protein (predicted Holliday junction resolvase)